MDFEVAPIVLGLVLSPMIETALRQSLAMSSGSYMILINRPIAAGMLGLAVALMIASLLPRGSWRRMFGIEG
jgi:putative tricarboxylic transport membrane protein